MTRCSADPWQKAHMTQRAVQEWRSGGLPIRPNAAESGNDCSCYAPSRPARADDKVCESKQPLSLGARLYACGDSCNPSPLCARACRMSDSFRLRSKWWRQAGHQDEAKGGVWRHAAPSSTGALAAPHSHNSTAAEPWYCSSAVYLLKLHNGVCPERKHSKPNAAKPCLQLVPH